MEGTKDVFLDSLDRCTDSGEFMATFYDRFVRSSPVVRARFGRSDMPRQAVALLASLRTLASAVAGDPAGLRELAARARTHDRDHMKITPDLYELWQAALIETAREFDAQWGPEVERSWRQTLDFVVEYMVKRY